MPSAEGRLVFAVNNKRPRIQCEPEHSDWIVYVLERPCILCRSSSNQTNLA